MLLRSKLLSSVLVVMATTLGATNSSSMVYGKWVVKRALHTTNISGLSQSEMNRIIGTHIYYSETGVRSGNFLLKSPKYSIEILTDKEFSDQFYSVPLDQLGIEDHSVDLVTIDGDNSDTSSVVGLTIFVPKKHRSLVVEFQGVFFELERMRPGTAKH